MNNRSLRSRSLFARNDRVPSLMSFSYLADRIFRDLHVCQIEKAKGSALLSVLVVEDFAPFRQLLFKILRTNPQVQFIAEADDGLQAIEKAHELQPDLILTDIGLPGLNGLEAVRQIRRLSPRSKLIVVSQEWEVEVVREAFRAGASGYVVKSDVAGELSVAVDAVLAGRHFVGNRFTGHKLTYWARVFRDWNNCPD